jgi:hypothetical protein
MSSYHVLDDAVRVQDNQPWSGVPPATSTELFATYLACMLARRPWRDPDCADRLGDLVPKRLKQQPKTMDDALVALFERIYDAFLDADGTAASVSDAELVRFYDATIPTNVRLPYVGTLDGVNYSWFFPVSNRTAWRSCFLKNERLREEMVAHVGLYGPGGLTVRAPYGYGPRVSLREEKAARELAELCHLVQYVQQTLAAKGSRMTLKDRELFKRSFMRILRRYAEEEQADAATL